MRGGSGATGPASSSGGAGAKGNLEHKYYVLIQFLFILIIDTYEYNKLLNYFTGGKNSKDRKYVMTTDDLANAMDDQGITVKKPPWLL